MPASRAVACMATIAAPNSPTIRLALRSASARHPLSTTTRRTFRARLITFLTVVFLITHPSGCQRRCALRQLRHVETVELDPPVRLDDEENRFESDDIH